MNTPVKEPEKKTNEEPVNETAFEVEEEKQIIVHCRCDSLDKYDSWIRIWKTTFLIDPVSEYKSDLLFAYNISFYPVWDLFPGNSSKKFTLVFGGLPKSCQIFDLIEVTDGTGAFESKGMIRNKEDIYNVVF
ncbi:MAG: hypothetical protein NTY07_18725 [Bacteroidia bacterium]|nr:hypothetical protein [Bacteroidia bacterium]